MHRLGVHTQELLFFFFFQAEDGIRDVAVTGVQTCALPISWTAHKRTLQPISLNMSPPTNAGWARSIIMIPQKFCGQNFPLIPAMRATALPPGARRKIK